MKYIHLLERVILNEYGYSFADLHTKSRRTEVAYLRFVVYKMLRDNTSLSFSKIGIMFNRNHTTVMHGINRIDNSKVYDSDLYRCYRTVFHLITTIQKSSKS
jgi:chromosomal replication initiator protein